VSWLKFLKKCLIDKHIKKLFKDLLSSHNQIHWRQRDIDYFLSTKGKIVFDCFKPVQPEEIDKLSAMIKSKNLKNIEKIIICVYTGIDISFNDFSKIIECVIASIPINQDKTGILVGLIEDETMNKAGISVKLVTVCSKYQR
jgi:hypothetical protein